MFSALGKTNLHCVKSVQIQSYFWSVFSRIRTEYGEILRISPYSVQMPGEYGKIRTRNNSVFGHFSCSVTVTRLLIKVWVNVLVLGRNLHCIYKLLITFCMAFCLRFYKLTYDRNNEPL